MTNDTNTATEARRPLPALLDNAKHLVIDELHRRLHEEGYATIRESHGCVFRFIDADGSRLTDLADSAKLSKQAVGEVVDDLERLGFVERAPHPVDGRAKIIRLTKHGQEAQATARRFFAEIERELAKRYGARRMALLRELLEEITEEGVGLAQPEAAAA